MPRESGDAAEELVATLLPLKELKQQALLFWSKGIVALCRHYRALSGFAP
jgi:hypothetical protein